MTMKPVINAILVLWLTAAGTAVLAQDPSTGVPNAPASAAEQPDASPDASLETDPPEEAAGNGDEAPEPDDAPDAASDPAALVEEDARVAASAEEEFNPDEEISEDYPVPLPSDI